MVRSIRIRCRGSGVADLGSFVDLQGNLKSLSVRSYEALRQSITTDGFIAPIFVWQSGAQNIVLDGHQRLRTIRKMVNDGFVCPPLPIVVIEAASLPEARRRLLSFVSQYGAVDRQGLYEFVAEAGIDPQLLVTDFAIPNIQIEHWMQEFVLDVSLDSLAAQGATSPAMALSQNDDAMCPTCGFRRKTP